MQKILISVFTVILLTGCADFPGVYKIDLPQGNVVTQEMVDTLRPGMTQNQVRFVLGTPLITDSFNQNRWDYIYRNQSGDTGVITQQRLTILFNEQGLLSGLAGDFRPGDNPQQ